MEHKAWLWKKRSTEKTMAAADKINQENEEEVQTLLTDKAELERELKILNEKLSSAIASSNDKDDAAKKHTSIAREAIAGWEKAEADAIALKQELDKVMQQRVADEERLICLDAALKECMQQLRFVREEQEKKIHDAVRRTSREFEGARTIFEEKLAETSKRLGKMSSENTQLTKALLTKEKVIADLKDQSTHRDANLSAVMSKLESLEKENVSLKYEVRMLEKELEIRNEEREFNQRTADVAHKKYLDSVKKMAKLESESQRLRMLVQKRLPGPVALVKMRNEVAMLSKDSTEARRRMSSPFPNASNSMPISLDHALDTPSQRVNFLTEQLCAMEEENRSLKESLNLKTSELQLSSVMYAHTASKLAVSNVNSLALSSDIGSDEKVSVIESWTPSCKTAAASDIGLMDDFVEMERLALVSPDKLDGSFPVSENISSTKKSSQQIDSDLSRSVRRIMDLIEGTVLSSRGYGSSEIFSKKDDICTPYTTSETSTGYMVRVFQWKACELGHVLEQFLQSCTSLLNGKADMVDFSGELTSALEWIINHCFSIQDVSSMRDEIMKQFDWDECGSDGEIEGGTIKNWTVHNGLFQKEEVRASIREEKRRLKDELANLKTAKKDLEEKLHLRTDKCESLTFQLQEFENSIASLQDEVENHNMQKNDLDNQLRLVNIELNEVRQDLESKNSCYEELEAAYLDQQLQLESLTKKCPQKHDLDHDNKQHRTLNSQDWEITAASEKIAECQKTILNLGKQLKAFASPKEASISDKVVSTTPDATKTITFSDKSMNQRSSLLDKMAAEEDAITVNLKSPDSPNTKEVICIMKSSNVQTKNSSNFSPQNFQSLNGIKHQKEEAQVDFLSIVPSKTKGRGGLLKKLFWRRKKGTNKKTPSLST